MSCSGPDGSRWSTELQHCVGGGQTSCDEATQTTCYYGYTDVPPEGGGGGGDTVADSSGVGPTKYFGGKFVDAGFCIDNPGELDLCGVISGDVITKINGHVITVRTLASYTPEKPARYAEKITSTSGQIKLRLVR